MTGPSQVFFRQSQGQIAEVINVSCDEVEGAIGYIWATHRVTPSFDQSPTSQMTAAVRASMSKRAFRRWRGRMRAARW